VAEAATSKAARSVFFMMTPMSVSDFGSGRRRDKGISGLSATLM
jgi:hypothetical protein